MCCKLLRPVRQELTTGRRLTKFGQLVLVIFGFSAILQVTANLGYLLFSRRSTRLPPSLLDNPASWIDGAKEMQWTPQPQRTNPVAGWWKMA
jgi:hypothetical protein